MIDASPLYAHYRESTGADTRFNYEKAYVDDPGIRKTVDKVIKEAQKWAEKLENDNCTPFSMCSDAEAQSTYPSTENWQKALGAHMIWGPHSRG